MISRNWSSDTVGQLPSGYMSDTGNATYIAVSATGFSGDSANCLATNSDPSSAHQLIASTGDPYGGDFTLTQDLDFVTVSVSVIFFRYSSTSFSSYTTYGLNFFQDPSTGGIALQRYVAGSDTTGGGATLVTVTNGGGSFMANSVPLTATIVAKGNVLTISVQRKSDSDYITSSGTYSATPQACITYTDTSGSAISGAGKYGYLWYNNAVTAKFGDFTMSPLVVTATLGTTPLTAGGATSTATASGFTGNTVVWTSSNTAVATINSSTGVYTPVGAGTCTFTATGAANSTQTATTGTLTVNASSAATSYTLTNASPASGFVANASANFAVQANGVPSVALVVTPTDSVGGTFTPTSVTITDGTVYHFTDTPNTTTGARTISVMHTGGGFSGDPASVTYTANARTLTPSPSSIPTSATTTVTLTGGGTKWTSSAPTFGSPGLTGASFGSVTVVNDTACTVSVTTGTTAGTITFTDSTTSATTTVAVSSVVMVPITSNANFGGVGYASLTGTVGLGWIDSSNNTISARTTSGIFEIVTNGIHTGCYVGTLATAVVDTTYIAVWDSGGSYPVPFTEPITAKATMSQVANAVATLVGGMPYFGTIQSGTTITSLVVAGLPYGTVSNVNVANVFGPNQLLDILGQKVAIVGTPQFNATTGVYTFTIPANSIGSIPPNGTIVLLI